MKQFCLINPSCRSSPIWKTLKSTATLKNFSSNCTLLEKQHKIIWKKQIKRALIKLMNTGNILHDIILANWFYSEDRENQGEMKLQNFCLTILIRTRLSDVYLISHMKLNLTDHKQLKQKLCTFQRLKDIFHRRSIPYRSD